MGVTDTSEAVRGAMALSERAPSRDALIPGMPRPLLSWIRGSTRHHAGRLGYVNPILYALARRQWPRAPFHDVARGYNRFYPAAPGWDPATGLGSPDVANLAADTVSFLRSLRSHARTRPHRRRGF